MGGFYPLSFSLKYANLFFSLYYIYISIYYYYSIEYKVK